MAQAKYRVPKSLSPWLSHTLAASLSHSGWVDGWVGGWGEWKAKNLVPKSPSLLAGGWDCV